MVALVRDGARLVTLTGPGRHGQDAAGDRGGRRAGAGVQGWRVLGRPGDAARPGARRRDDRADARREGRTGRAHRRARDAAAARQPRAGGRRGARARRAARGAARTSCCWSPAASCCGCAARSSTRFRRWPSRTQSSCSARARSVEPTTTVAELCRRLDNLPLARRARRRAGERAHRRRRSSSGSRSGSTCFKGGRDADPRQQTLRATIEWSYDLLSSRRAAAVRAARGLRRRLHARGRRAGRRRRPRHAAVARRQEPRPPHR